MNGWHYKGIPALAALAGSLSLASADTFRVAFGSCAGQNEPQPIWQTIVASDPDLWIWAGDNVYMNTEDEATLRAAYATLMSHPDYQQFLAAGVPVLATWDDHDFGKNDGGAEFAFKSTSQQVLLDFLGVAADDPRRDREGVYHAEIFGEAPHRTQVILLDTRYHRSPLQRYPREDGLPSRGYKPDRSESATFLGQQQWEWLEQQLLKPAELRLIVSSIQVVSNEHRFEKWANFPAERNRLIDLIRTTGASGVVLLSGDRHHGELSRIVPDGLYPLHDLTSSGINKSRSRAPSRSAAEINHHRIGPVVNGHHFATITVNWALADPLVELALITRDGDRPVQKSLPLSMLNASAWQAAAGNGPLLHSINNDPSAATVMLDGDVHDWAHEGWLDADERHLLMRIRTPETRSLRAGNSVVEVFFELDSAEAGTGVTTTWGQGMDLKIAFGEMREDGRRSWQPSVHRLPGGEAVEPHLLGLAVGPTHASQWFELRIDRAALAAAMPLAQNAPSVTVHATTRNHDATAAELLASASIDLPAASPADFPATMDASLPVKPDAALRVLALNMLWASQLDNPLPFARLVKAIDADVYLLQEWSRDRIADTEVRAWFHRHVDANVDWQTAISGVSGSWSGTMVVSRYPITSHTPRLTPVSAGGWDFPARMAAAVIEAPIGRVLAASVHLKAGGFFQSPEDDRRIAEADAINRILLGMQTVARADMVVLGGDFNLNGTTAVMDIATRMLDIDQSSLTVARPAVLGDPGLLYTFGINGVRSRLDYITYSDYSSVAAHAFVLDSTILSPASLRAMGIESTDSEATDHLPVVVDLQLR